MKLNLQKESRASVFQNEHPLHVHHIDVWSISISNHSASKEEKSLTTKFLNEMFVRWSIFDRRSLGLSPESNPKSWRYFMTQICTRCDSNPGPAVYLTTVLPITSHERWELELLFLKFSWISIRICRHIDPHAWDSAQMVPWSGKTKSTSKTPRKIATRIEIAMFGNQRFFC